MDDLGLPLFLETPISQVIQVVTFLFPSWRWRTSHWKGHVFTIPKRSQRIARSSKFCQFLDKDPSWFHHVYNNHIIYITILMHFSRVFVFFWENTTFFVGKITYSAKGPWSKSLNFIVPIKYDVIPKSLKVGHRLSQITSAKWVYHHHKNQVAESQPGRRLQRQSPAPLRKV